MEHHKHRQIKLGTIIESSCEFCGKVGRVVYRVDPASEGDRGWMCDECYDSAQDDDEYERH